MDFFEAVKSGFQGYVDFSGRSSRSEVWWWILFGLMANVIASLADFVVGGGVFAILVSLGLLLPSVSVQVRRLHDLDRSGWWLLISLVPVLGAIVMLVWFCSKGTADDNRFGANPLS